MMAVRNLISRLKFWKRNAEEDILNKEFSPEYRLANRLKRYEKYVSRLQSIVMWDNPSISIACILSINVLFWVFVSLEWRFYGIVSSLLWAVLVHEAWTAQVWPEISVKPSAPEPEDVLSTPHPSVEAVSRVVTASFTTFKQFFTWSRNFRARQPGLFCCSCSLVCSILLLLGRVVPGLLLVYTLLMSLLLGPGIFHHCVPPHLKQTFSQYVSCVRSTFAKYSPSDSSDDEYIPVTTSEDLALLTRASDLQHDTYDSLTNPGSSSDITPGSVMPSHEEDSLSDLDPGPLDPPDSGHQIEFQSGHFNGESSSSDEEAFARDLYFSEADERDGVGQGLTALIAQAVTSNVLGSVGLLANVVRQRRPIRRTDSDSDNEDFEIINRDELNNQ